MIDEYEDEIICDLAETYHILDYTELPLFLVATLVFGLKDDSRLKMKMRGEKISLDVALKARAVDALNWLCWSKTEDATKGKNEPSSILDAISGKSASNGVVSFENPNDFEKERKKIINGN